MTGVGSLHSVQCRLDLCASLRPLTHQSAPRLLILQTFPIKTEAQRGDNRLAQGRNVAEAPSPTTGWLRRVTCQFFDYKIANDQQIGASCYSESGLQQQRFQIGRCVHPKAQWLCRILEIPKEANTVGIGRYVGAEYDESVGPEDAVTIR